MASLGLFAALAFPWLLGCIALAPWWPKPQPGRLPLLLGYGLLLGWALVAMGLWVWGAAGARFSLLAGLAPALVALGSGWWGYRRMGPWQLGEPLPLVEREALGSWVGLLLLAILALRGFDLLYELVTQPLFAWDSWMNWSPKTKVWFFSGYMEPFVAPKEWLARADEPLYTISTYHYPPLVPLMQLWGLLGLGRWDDTLMNLPWWFALVGLGLAFYGQGRGWGLSPLTALVFVYLLLSMPFIGVHVALPGYADIWLAAFYGLSAMALLRWAGDGDRRQLVLALLFGITCIAVKLPGTVWAVTLLPAIVGYRLRWRHLVIPLILCAVPLILLFSPYSVTFDWPWGGGEFRIGAERLWIPGFTQSVITYRPVAGAVLANTLAMPNWHLFWYLLPLALIYAVLVAGVRWVRVGLLLVVSGLLLLGFIYFFTDRAQFVTDYTIVNRGLLHMVPAQLFFIALLWWHLTGGRPAAEAA